MSLAMYAAVAIGGALGAMLRYSVSLMTGAGFFGINGPVATLTVNKCASGVIGLLAGLVAGGLILPELWRAFLKVGLLGALTTFSSFALNAGALFQKQGLGMAGVYIALSRCLSLGSFALSYWLVRLP